MTHMLPPKLFFIIAALMVGSSLVAGWPGFPTPFGIIGIVLVVVGLALTVGNAALFQRMETNIQTFNDPTHLVRHGSFRWTRNPMYLGFLLVLSGLALVLGSVVTVLGPLAFFLAADQWYIPFEERRMAACFGRDYESYRQDVYRWFGRRRSA